LPEAVAEAVPAMEFFMRRYLLPGADIGRKKSAVRAVPICKLPVGLGAILTLIFSRFSILKL